MKRLTGLFLIFSTFISWDGHCRRYKPPYSRAQADMGRGDFVLYAGALGGIMLTSLGEVTRDVSPNDGALDIPTQPKDHKFKHIFGAEAGIKIPYSPLAIEVNYDNFGKLAFTAKPTFIQAGNSNSTYNYKYTQTLQGHLFTLNLKAFLGPYGNASPYFSIGLGKAIYTTKLTLFIPNFQYISESKNAKTWVQNVVVGVNYNIMKNYYLKAQVKYLHFNKLRNEKSLTGNWAERFKVAGAHSFIFQVGAGIEF